MISSNNSICNNIRLSNYYFKPKIIEKRKNFEKLLRGLFSQTIQKADSTFHEEITEFLFRSNKDYGMDLESIDIQRGRDHGIPGYNEYRKICKLKYAKGFFDLLDEISFNVSI